MLAQGVSKLVYRYGEKSDEWEDSFVSVRIDAFASKACLCKSFGTISLVAPIRGVTELTDSEYGSAHLVVWIRIHDFDSLGYLFQTSSFL